MLLVLYYSGKVFIGELDTHQAPIMVSVSVTVNDRLREEDASSLRNFMCPTVLSISLCHY